MMLLLDEFPTVLWSEFSPEVTVSVGDVPADMAESYIRQAAIDLAVRSQVLVRDFELVPQAGVTEYLLDTQGCERVESVQRIGSERGCGVDLRHGQHLHIEGARFTWPGRIQLTTPDTCAAPMGRSWAHGPTSFSCGTPGPRPAASIWVRAAVAPTRDSCEGDAVLYERYHEAVTHGAMARLFLVKSSPWYDPALAAYHRARAGEHITAAGLDRLTGGMRGAFKMKARRVI